MLWWGRLQLWWKKQERISHFNDQLRKLKSGLHSGNDKRVIEAIMELQHLGGPQAINGLLPLVDNYHPSIKWAAIEALNHLAWEPANADQRAWSKVISGQYKDALAEGSAAGKAFATALIRRDSEQLELMIVICNIRDKYAVRHLIEPLRWLLKNKNPLLSQQAEATIKKVLRLCNHQWDRTREVGGTGTHYCKLCSIKGDHELVWHSTSPDHQWTSCLICDTRYS